jgi:hypothetical protein
MDLDLTEPFTQLLLLLWGDVLVSEEDNAPFRNQEPQLVFLLVVKILELQPHDLGSDVLGEVNDLLRCRQQSLLLRIGAGSRVNVRAIIVSDVVDIINVERPSRPVRIPG